MMKETNFIKVRCQNCSSEQTIYEKATTEVKCNSCNALLAKPSGGNAKIKAKIIERLRP